MKRTIVCYALLLALVFPSGASALAADDCPPGHIRNPQVSPLDHPYMVQAFTASFRGIFGRNPSMQPGSGLDDGEYYIAAADHFGVYGDDQCHAGWSGYWESWLEVGHGDLGRVQTPAKFLPGNAPSPVPTPTPTPGPTPVQVVTVDLTPILTSLALIKLQVENTAARVEVVNQLVQDTNANVQAGREENRSFFGAVAAHWKKIVGYAAPIVGGLLAGKYGLVGK